MNTVQVMRQGADTSAGYSVRLWADCPILAFLEQPGRGFIMRDDFVHTNITTAGQYQIVTDTAFTILATEVGGVLRQPLSATDNAEGYIGSNNDLGGAVKLVKGKKLWWEARIRTSVITSGSLIVGLAEETAIAANMMADTQTDAAIIDTSDFDFLGFLMADDTSTAEVDAIYRTAGNTAHTIHSDDTQTLVADTWYKFGMRYDGGEIIRYYVDGVQKGTDLDPDTTDVPDGEEMGFIFGAKSSTTAATNVDMDWWAVAMER